MPLFPAAKLMDSVVGIDVHAVAPIPGIPVHPYAGPLYLWTDPTFPSASVFINGLPALSVGAMGYFAHVPQGVPVPPTPTNTPYWKRYLTNVAMGLTLAGLTAFANLAIAGISTFLPRNASVDGFIKDVTGIDVNAEMSTWERIKGSFASLTQWTTWIKLLMPPMPYPGAQGSTAVGSPNVTVNGGPLAFVGPLVATSCSDIPIVPNAMTLGFSNVMVGVSFADLVRGIAVQAAQGAVQHGIGKGVSAAQGKWQERKQQQGQNNKCSRPGHPIDPVTGATEDELLDFAEPGPSGFRWMRLYKSRWNGDGGPLGYGFRHSWQHELWLSGDTATHVDPEGRCTVFPRDEAGRYGGTGGGWALEDLGDGRFVLRHGAEGTLGFQRDPIVADCARLVGRVRAGLRDTIAYGQAGELAFIRQGSVEKDNGTPELEYRFQHDASGRITEILRCEPSGTMQAIVQYAYHEAGCLVEIRDALGHASGHAYDADRRMVRVTDRNGYSFHYRYDDQGRCVESMGDDGLWHVSLLYVAGRTLVTEADGGLWVFRYDEAATVTEIHDPYGGVEHRETAPDGRVLREVDSGGRATQLLYDAAGRNTGRLDQWGNGLPPRDEAPNLPNPLTHRIPETALQREFGDMAAPAGAASHPAPHVPPGIAECLSRFAAPADEPAPGLRRDALGRILERRDAGGHTEHFAYDAAGNCVAATDKDGRAYRSEYASWNLCVAQVDPLGQTTRYGHTRREQVASILDAGGNRSEYAYDLKDRLVQVLHHGALHESYRYDAGDRLIEKSDREGNVLLCYEVGADGLHSKRILTSGEIHSFAHDERGNFIEASTATAKVEFGYRQGRRVADLRDGLGVTHAFRADTHVETAYLARFPVAYEALEPGDILIHTPDGRSHRVQRSDRGVLKRFSNGTCEWRSFDAQECCAARVVWRDGDETPRWTTRYRYSPAGELREVQDSRSGQTVNTYDAAHRLVAQTGPGGERRFAYDAAGNLTSTPDRPVIAHALGNLVVSAGAEAFEHDIRDNLAAVTRADGSRTVFRYDSLDSLVGILGAPGCGEWEAEYDGLCRRTAKIVDGRRTEYFWDGDRLAAELRSEGGVRLYVYPDHAAVLPFMLIDYPSLSAEPRDGKPYFVMHDQVGLPLAIEDATGREVWRARSIDPYGRIEASALDGFSYNLRFPGQYFDAETGLCYNRFRYYDPSLGRYIQFDPLGQAGGTNLYAYPGNPLVEVDFLGLTHKGDANVDGDAGQAKPGTQKAVSRKEQAARRGANDNNPDGNFYPKRTQAAHEASAQVHKALKATGDDNCVVAVYTHEDGSRSVGLSTVDPARATQVENHLNQNAGSPPTTSGQPKWRVRGDTDPELDNALVAPPHRDVPPENCAEPRAASAAHQNKSPINGFSTSPSRDYPGEPYKPPRGSPPGEMGPCDSCGPTPGNEGAINRHANSTGEGNNLGERW